MPGPCNNPRKIKGYKKAQKTKANNSFPQKHAPRSNSKEQNRVTTQSSSPSFYRNLRDKGKSVVYNNEDANLPYYYYEDCKQITPESYTYVPELEEPFMYDPGTGPRVRDPRRFLESKFFAQPPAWEDPLCAELAQEEVIQMLMTILPEEIALVLWYNKTRSTSRICPACQRLYRVGDTLPELVLSDKPVQKKAPPVQLRQEQELSGLCSPMCFIVACFNYPGAIKTAWGRTEEEMDDETWNLINGPPASNTKNETGVILGLLMKMTRLHDLGLGQLCLGINSDEDIS